MAETTRTKFLELRSKFWGVLHTLYPQAYYPSPDAPTPSRELMLKDYRARQKTAKECLQLYGEIKALAEGNPELGINFDDVIQEIGRITTFNKQLKGYIQDLRAKPSPEDTVLVLSDSVSNEDVVWLAEVLAAKDWLSAVPTDKVLTKVLGRRDGRSLSQNSLSTYSVKSLYPGSEEKDGVDQEKRKKFRAFLADFPEPPSKGS